MATGLRHIATEPANLSRRSEASAQPPAHPPILPTDLDTSQLNSVAQMKRSPLLRNKSTKKSVAGTASDSDGSMDSNSLSAESNNEQNHKPSSKETAANTTTAPATGKKNRMRRGSEWEILEGLKDGQRYDRKPDRYSGFLLKKRKWPLKGWHKRYFLVEKGILIYGKGPADVARGKLHGSVDIGLSVISSKLKRWRIDIDTEEYIYHLKVLLQGQNRPNVMLPDFKFQAKSEAVFLKWVEQLKFHRLYRQHLLTFGPGPRDGRLTLTPGRHSPASAPPEREKRESIKCCSPPPVGVVPLLNSSAGVGSKVVGATSSSSAGGPPTAAGRLAVWMVDVQPTLESVNRELLQVNHSISLLARTLEQIENMQTLDVEQTVIEGSSPNVKKDRKKFGLRKKKCSKGSSMDLTATCSPSKSNVDIDSASPLSTCSMTGLSTSPGCQATINRLSSSNSSLPSAGGLAAPPAGCPTPGQITSSGSSTAPLSAPPSASSGVAMRPQSLPGPEHLVPLCASSAESSRVSLSCTPDNQLRDDFTALARDVHSCLHGVMQTLVTEKDRLKAALEIDSSFMSPAAPGIASLPGLRASLSQALQQNQDLRTRLARIHETADISDVTTMEKSLWRNHLHLSQKPIHASLSYSSSCLSASEFFDAEEHHDSRESPTDEATGLPFEEAGDGDGDAGQLSDTSSEAGSLSSEEGSVSSENSEIATEEFNTVDNSLDNKCMTGHRTKLPAPRPDTEGLSLWNLLCKNIGKDLSQVSMPVTLNEPLNMLQRLCEELEYSELLDKAAELSDPIERMIHVAAFTVSSYGSSYFRAGSKPFNPILGETYECVREDKGFRFIAEQVSHHPPISVCYAESRNFIFWQDARIKTKFWGKSMEFQPTGSVSLQLPKWNELYTWNKVTTCVHNLFGGQRWVDQYGELRISCNTGISCKLTFVKASYWSAKRHEVYGSITDADGKEVRNLFGKWSEALYCGVAPAARCIWRRGTMPEDFERYYGFTRFAVELNELDSETAKYLPCTDTRFRPDQRLLEEGQVSAAEELKMQLEQSQRERRRIKEQEGIQHVPRWFSKRTTASGEEVWEYNHKYWDTRKSPGFVNLAIEKLW